MPKEKEREPIDWKTHFKLKEREDASEEDEIPWQ